MAPALKLFQESLHVTPVEGNYLLKKAIEVNAVVTPSAWSKADGGQGLPNTDYAFIVRVDQTSLCISGGMAAYAGPCAFDQHGRPVLG